MNTMLAGFEVEGCRAPTAAGRLAALLDGLPPGRLWVTRRAATELELTVGRLIQVKPELPEYWVEVRHQTHWGSRPTIRRARRILARAQTRRNDKQANKQ